MPQRRTRSSRYEKIIGTAEPVATEDKRRMPLMIYFKSHYLPDRQPTRETVERCVLAIKRYASFLAMDTPTTPEHVTFPALDRFTAEAPERFKISAGQAAKYRTMLLAIARHAGVEGLPCKQTGPAPDPQSKRRNRRKRVNMLRDRDRAFRRRLIRIARMYVEGLTLATCAGRFGLQVSSLEVSLARHRDRWERALRFYRQRITTEPELSPRQRWQLEVAAMCRVNGSRWEAIAETLKIEEREARSWPVRYRLAWRQATIRAAKSARNASLNYELAKLLAADPEADARLREQDETAPTEAITTLSGFFERCYRPTKLQDAVPSTLVLYRHCIRIFRKYLGREPQLSDLAEDTLAGFLSFCTRVLGNRSVTANNRVRHLKAIAKLAKRRKLIPELPEIDLLKVPKRRKVALSMEELGRLLGACQAQPGFVGIVPAGQWWHNFVTFAYRTALRRRALLGARWEMLNGNILTVPSELVKTLVDAVFVLPDDFVQSLNEMPRDESGLIFPLGKSERQFLVHFRRIRSQAGLPDIKDPLHQLRRTAATHIANAYGITTAQQVLHHACLATTQSYVDPALSDAGGKVAALPQPEAVPLETDPSGSLTLLEILQLKQRGAEHYRTALAAIGSNATELARRAGLHPKWVSRALNHWYPIEGEAADKLDAAIRELVEERGMK